MRHFIVRQTSRRLLYGGALVLLIAFLIGAAAACQRSRSRPASATPPAAGATSAPNRENSLVVQPNAGGEIMLASGAALAIPPDALSASTVVNLRGLDAPPAAPIPRSIIGQAYEFTLEGGELTGIAMLTLPLPANFAAEQYDISAYRWTGRAWERVAGRVAGHGLRLGADKPGLFAVLGQWRMAEASLTVAIPPTGPARPTVSIQVSGRYRYTAPPQMQHDVTPATLLLKRDSTGGAGQISGDESIDQTVAQTTLYFKPNPNQADGLIDFTYTFDVSPGDVDVALGSIARFYAALSVADSAAPTRRLSTGADYTQMLPIQVVGSEVVRPELSDEATQALQWHVQLNGETLFRRAATGARLSLADILAQGGLGEYKIALESELDGKLTPVSNEVTVQLALPVTATPPFSDLAYATPGPGTPTVWPFGTMPPTPTRRAGPGSGGVPGDGLGTPGAPGAPSAPGAATPTLAPTTPPTPTPTVTRTPVPNSVWADKYSVAAGECVRISWHFENVARVLFGDTAVTGVDSRTECVTTTTTFTLYVTDAAGNTKPHPITITVPGTSTTTDIEFTASRYQITLGESLTLNWTVAGAREVYLLDSGNGERYPVDGVSSKEVSPGINTAYTLEVLGSNGVTVFRQINIFVTAADAVTMQFWAESYTMGDGECTTLHWSVEKVIEVTLKEGADDAHGVAGVSSLPNACPNGKKQYVLSALNAPDATPTVKKLTLLSGAPNNASLADNEIIAAGWVRSVSYHTDLDSASAGNQPGYRLEVDSFDKRFAGNGSCCGTPLIVEVTQDQAVNRVGEFLDWPINQEQPIEFRAFCTNNTCRFSEISDRQYLKMTSH